MVTATARIRLDGLHITPPHHPASPNNNAPTIIPWHLVGAGSRTTLLIADAAQHLVPAKRIKLLGGRRATTILERARTRALTRDVQHTNARHRWPVSRAALKSQRRWMRLSMIAFLLMATPSAVGILYALWFVTTSFSVNQLPFIINRIIGVVVTAGLLVPVLMGYIEAFRMHAGRSPRYAHAAVLRGSRIAAVMPTLRGFRTERRELHDLAKSTTSSRGFFLHKPRRLIFASQPDLLLPRHTLPVTRVAERLSEHLGHPPSRLRLWSRRSRVRDRAYISWTAAAIAFAIIVLLAPNVSGWRLLAVAAASFIATFAAAHLLQRLLKRRHRLP